MNQNLGSKWDGLSKWLQATLYPVDSTGARIPDMPAIVAPATDVEMDLNANWNSPFEGSGVDAIIPKFSQALQTGMLANYGDLLTAVPGVNTALKFFDMDAASLKRSVQASVSAAAGRTGMTKLNSTQVFVGAAPVQISLSLHFRAMNDPLAEVRQPIDQLAQWLLSQQMAESSTLVNAVEKLKQGASFAEILLPSRTPQMVALVFGGYTFSPLVIEGMQRPMSGPRHSGTGELLHAKIPLKMATLTALDKEDWARAGRGEPTKLFTQKR